MRRSTIRICALGPAVAVLVGALLMAGCVSHRAGLTGRAGVSSWSPPTPEETAAALDGLPFDAFVEMAYKHLMLHEPTVVTASGLADEYGVRNDCWPDYSPEGRESCAACLDVISERLDRFSLEDLTHEQQLTRAVLIDMVGVVSEEGEEEVCAPVFHATESSLHTWPIHHLVNVHPLQDRSDVEDYLSRLAGLANLIEQGIVLEQERIDSGCPTPWYSLQALPLSVAGAMPQDVGNSTLIKSLQERLPAIVEMTEEERANAID